MTRLSTALAATGQNRLSRGDILAHAGIVPKLARSTDGDDIPEGIVGATILGFGTIAWEELDDVCLVIEYAPCDGSPPRRVSLGFSELGMWVEHLGEIGATRRLDPNLGCDQQ